MIGSLAPQGINDVVIIVILLSFSLSIVREAKIPGTLHPVPISIGMNDLPESPNFLNILSITNAILAIYPQPSRIARRRNSTSICGKKPSTAPTPPMIPSIISPLSQGAQFIASSPPPTRSGMLGTNVP